MRDRTIRGGALRLRPATAEDREAVATIHHRGWTESYRGLLPAAHLDGLSYEACYERWGGLPDGATTVVVAEVDGQAIGFCSYGPSADTDAGAAGEIWDLWVFPDHRGAGIGSRLLRHAMGDLARRHRAAVVWVLATNLAGRRFYEREGGVRDGVSRTQPVDGGSMTDVRYLFDLRGLLSHQR